MNSPRLHSFRTTMIALYFAGMALAPAQSRFPAYEQLLARAEFPDPLTMLDGTKVTSARQWEEKRRPELKALFQHYMYGQLPPAPAKLDFQEKVLDEKFLGGKATLKSVTIAIPGTDLARIDLLLITPNAVRKAPVFLAMNFCGNHAIHADARIPLTRGWLYSSCKGCANNAATEAARGGQAGDWPVEQIIDRGYALATFCSTDVDSDRADVSDGVHGWVARLRGGPDAKASTADRGCIAGWAWGYQRCVDYLVTDRRLDKGRIAAVGHSRNGKTALLAAAFDERIALSIPHQAGSGGTGPSRVAPAMAALQGGGRPKAETIAVINKNFPHWFNGEFKKFNEHPEKLPIDQNCLVALMAPRPVLLSNALEDQWANPSGQFEVLQAAEPVYRLLQVEGLKARQTPEVGHLVDSKLGYYIRLGKHSMIPHDWEVFLKFADRHFQKK